MRIRTALRFGLRAVGALVLIALAYLVGISAYNAIRTTIIMYSCYPDDNRIMTVSDAIGHFKRHWYRTKEDRDNPDITNSDIFMHPESSMNVIKGWAVESRKEYGRVVWNVRLRYGRFSKELVFTECGHPIEEWTSR